MEIGTFEERCRSFDNAWAYSSHVTSEHLATFKWTVFPHMPYLPDPAPSDYAPSTIEFLVRFSSKKKKNRKKLRSRGTSYYAGIEKLTFFVVFSVAAHIHKNCGPWRIVCRPLFVTFCETYFFSWKSSFVTVRKQRRIVCCNRLYKHMR